MARADFTFCRQLVDKHEAPPSDAHSRQRGDVARATERRHSSMAGTQAHHEALLAFSRCVSPVSRRARRGPSGGRVRLFFPTSRRLGTPLSLTSLTVSPPTLPSQARGRRPTRGRSRSGTDGARPVVSRARLRTAPHAHSFFFIFARAHAAGVADRVSSLPHHHAPPTFFPPRSP